MTAALKGGGQSINRTNIAANRTNIAANRHSLVSLGLYRSSFGPALTRGLTTVTIAPKRPLVLGVSNTFFNHTRIKSTTASSGLEIAAAIQPIKRRSRIVNTLYKTFAFCGFTVITIGGLVIAFFLYDASTYKDEVEAFDIPIPVIALNPRRGGPKNLPIAEVLVDDLDDEDKIKQTEKPKMVVLGCGWGSVALLKNLNPDNYHVTVVSANNYFLYTPLLPSATVGTLELRSLVEPIRRIVSRVKGHFLQGKAVDVDFSEKLVEVSQTLPNGEVRNFYLPYDKLVIGVGMFLDPRVFHEWPLTYILK